MARCDKRAKWKIKTVEKKKDTSETESEIKNSLIGECEWNETGVGLDE